MADRRDANASPISFPAHVARLPKRGLPVLIEADSAQRAALALAHGLEAVEKFTASLLVEDWKRGGIRVSGRVEANIVQACVVTLEPVPAVIDEAVEALFVPEGSKLDRFDRIEGGELTIDAEGPDGPEPFSGDTIDVGALAEEFFELAIDPYPRSPGAAAAAAGMQDAPADADESPFAKLAAIRAKSRDGG